MADWTIEVSAPGRICLFGEHQDYLGLPVVAAAISLRITVRGKPRRDRKVILHLPDIQQEESFVLENPVPYVHERDYLRSVVNVLQREGASFRHGFECEVHGEIPINAGTSSSSALCVAWVKFLLTATGDGRQDSFEEIARLAHLAEVVEFGEPGGMMDHYLSSLGFLQLVEFVPKVVCQRLPVELGTFVLGDSGEPKDTKDVLRRVKVGVLEASQQILAQEKEFDLHRISLSDLVPLLRHVDREKVPLVEAVVENREITRKAEELFTQVPFDHFALSRLLEEHQNVLRDKLRISTPKIDRMLAAAKEAGALGGKINGSGGGGCMFAYAPFEPENVAQAVEEAGGRAYLVRVAEGVRIDREN